MIYQIKDLDEFAKATKKEVAKQNDIRTKYISRYIKEENIKALAKKYIFSDDDKLYISEKDTIMLFNDVNEWVIGIELSRMAGEDIINCYWDNDKDCMIFYMKDFGENNNGKTDKAT